MFQQSYSSLTRSKETDVSKKMVFTLDVRQSRKVIGHSQYYYGFMDFLGDYGALTLILYALLNYVYNLYIQPKYIVQLANSIFRF